MKRHVRLVALIGAMAIVVAACSPGNGGAGETPTTGATEAPAATEAPTTTEAMEPVSMDFLLNWFAVSDHAAYYVAQDNGWYVDGGLDVQILEGSGSGPAVTNVGAGQADCGVADAGVVINGIRAGAPVTIVAGVFDKSSSATWSSIDNPIRTPADLAGKLIGAPAGDSQRLLWPALAAANGMAVDDVEFLDIQPQAKTAVLAAGQVDAVFDAITGGPLHAEALGGEENAVSMLWADNGLDLYGFSVICNNDYLAANGDAVRSFLDATYRAWVEVMNEPRASLEVMQETFPEIDVDQFMGILEIGLTLMCTDRYLDNGIGWIDGDKLANSVEVISTYTEAEGDIEDPSAIFTNEYQTRYDIPEGICG